MRALWFAAGTAAGVYATPKVRRAAEALTVDGIHDRLTGWFAGARVLGEELRVGAFEKETELRSRLALGPDEAGESGNVLQLDGHRRRPAQMSQQTNNEIGKGDS